MQSISYYENIIKEKRKKTPFRKFLMEIASWYCVSFYKTQGIISRFPESSRTGPILEQNAYLKQYVNSPGEKEYDFSKSFFENFSTFFREVPKMSRISYLQNPNCDFADTVFGAQNAYLSVCVGETADGVLYSNMAYNHVENVLNSLVVCENSSNIYFSKLISSSFNIFFSRFITNSGNIWFSSNCIGCHECIFCDDLENQSYCIANKKLSKEEYHERKAEILSKKEMFMNYFMNVSNKAKNQYSSNTSGTGILFSKDVQNGFYVSYFKNARNIGFAHGKPLTQNVMDVYDIGKSDDTYAWMGVGQNSHHMFCGTNASESSYIYYSHFMGNCSFCLGCVGLTNKSYCILNKQYSREAWFQMVEKIFNQMEQEGVLGDFLPHNIHPFYFNDTAAYLIDDSFTKEEVEKEGYMWRDEPIKADIPEGTEVIQTTALKLYQGFDQSGNWKIRPEIMNKVIQDEHGNVYRIVPMEYDFLMKHALPLPEIHWLDRMKMGFQMGI